jgi:hypothetical protein
LEEDKKRDENMLNRRLRFCLLPGVVAGILAAQGPEDIAKPHPAEPAASTAGAPPHEAAPATGGLKRLEPPAAGTYVIQPGTRILLNMINSVSTRHAAVGDRIYLETAFPVLSEGKIVIPQGSWVQGTIFSVKRPKRAKGRGALSVRFDSLTLPNGVSRDFTARVGSMDGRSAEDLDRENGKITAPGNKAGDAGTIANTTITGAGVGGLAGAATGGLGKGVGIGAAAGAAAGLAGVLLSRGPDATLNKGTTMEMVVDRPLTFKATELDFSHVPPRAALSEGTGPDQPANKSGRRGWSPWPL